MPRLTEREQTIRLGRAIQARQLREAGWSLRAIGKKLRVSEATVRSDLRKCAASAQLVPAPERKVRTSYADASNVIALRRPS
jgi:lambda repressor-like predicted transcriptional regulator